MVYLCDRLCTVQYAELAAADCGREGDLVVHHTPRSIERGLGHKKGEVILQLCRPKTCLIVIQPCDYALATDYGSI